MALPFVIDYLLAQERPGGGRFVFPGVMQLSIPIFPAYTTLDFSFPPPTSIYAQIWTWYRFGNGIVPGAFEGWVQQAGTRAYDMVIYDMAGNNVDFFIVASQAEPVLTKITNLTPLNQYYEGYSGFIDIKTEGDYELVTEHIKRIGTSAKLESVAIEAKGLLQRMAVSSIRPPLRPPL